MRVHRERLGDFDLLAGGHGELLDQRPRRHVRPDRVEHRDRIALHPLAIDEMERLEDAAIARLARHKDIGGSSLVGGEREFLVNRGDAQRLGLGGIVGINLVLAQEDPPRVFVISSSENLHERRFARAVLAQ